MYNSDNKGIGYYRKRLTHDISNLAKWLLLAIITGTVVGGVSSLFAQVLGYATAFRGEHDYIFLLLPAAGLLITFLYEKFGQEDRGTNQVLSTIRSQDDVPMRSAPLIIVSTILTHLFGGSAGREGAAIQLGGSIGNQLGRWIHLDEEDKHIIIMCGMCAAFAAVFGTPMAAAVFAMEVVSVGVMYYSALFPCVISALIASGFSENVGNHPEAFYVSGITDLTIINGIKIGIVALGCALVSIIFCMMLTLTGKLYAKFFKSPYHRILGAGFLIILITALLGTDRYMGSGTTLIKEAVIFGTTTPLTFFWKMLLTALTMKAGFRGGEIVPAFSIGASFGCLLGPVVGLSPSLCAAAGMAALFCGVTNCPITSILIAFEMFGFRGSPYYIIAVAVSYAFSGYYGLYKDQTIVYSKYKAKYINQQTHQ